MCEQRWLSMAFHKFLHVVLLRMPPRRLLWPRLLRQRAARRWPMSAANVRRRLRLPATAPRRTPLCRRPLQRVVNDKPLPSLRAKPPLLERPQSRWLKRLLLRRLWLAKLRLLLYREQRQHLLPKSLLAQQKPLLQQLRQSPQL